MLRLPAPSLSLAALALAGCSTHRLPQPLDTFEKGILLELPAGDPANPDRMGAASFEALVESEERGGLLQLAPVPGLQVTCSLRSRRLRVSALGKLAQLGPSSSVKVDCPLGGAVLPVTVVW